MIFFYILGLVLNFGLNEGHFNFDSRYRQEPPPNSCPPSYEEHPLLLISLDGFRADYLTRGLTPNINRLANLGIKAPYMKPSFPTSTFPNHYTIVTGLMPAYHGIVANRFYDPDLKEEFHRGSYESHDKKWWKGEPIWRTVMNHGKIAATYFWVGSEVRGLHPTTNYWYNFNGSIPFKTRVEQVLNWIDLPKDKRPSFMSLYMHEPDKQGHKHGPNSDQVNTALGDVDIEIGRLLKGIESRNLLDCINVLLVADHGMAAAGPTRVVEIDKYIPEIRNETRFWDGVFARFQPKDDTEDKVYDYMKKLSCQKPEMRVYHKKQLPVRWHMNHQKRVESIVLDFDGGYQAAIKENYEPDAGDHGYDNYFSVMNAMFIAHGPDLRKGIEVEAFQNIELYNLMCELLKITPAENNGTLGALNHLLRNPLPPPIPKLENLPTVSVFPRNESGLYKTTNLSKCPDAVTNFGRIIDGLYYSESIADHIVAECLPWGTPLHGEAFDTINLLINQDHVTGYSAALNQPLWVSFTLMGSRPTYIQNELTWISDPRIPIDAGNNVCTSNVFLRDYGIQWQPLFHPQFSSSKSTRLSTSLTSNGIPMSDELSKRLKSMRILVSEWLESYGTLNVIMGPVFDYNSDTFVDKIVVEGTKHRIAVPSHLFMVVSRCQRPVNNMRECPSSFIDVMAFIIPQNLIVSNCMEKHRFAQEFSAKLQDVEKITGLSFFPWLPFSDRIKLQIRIHSNIWGYETWANRLRSDLFRLKR